MNADIIPHGISHHIRSHGRNGYTEEERRFQQEYIERVRLYIETHDGICIDCWNHRTRCRKGHIYIAKYNGLYKIGMTERLQRRLETLNRLGPHTLVLAIPGDCIRPLERQLHKRFAAQRVRGEYFRLTESDLDELRQLSHPQTSPEEVR